MPPKKDAAPKSSEPSASRLAAMAWKPTPFTHINFIRGFSTMMEKQVIIPIHSLAASILRKRLHKHLCSIAAADVELQTPVAVMQRISISPLRFISDPPADVAS